MYIYICIYIYIYIYIERYIHNAKIFLPSHHGCKRIPRASRLVHLPAREFGPRTALRAVGEGIITLW